jgi:hypothetical protein
MAFRTSIPASSEHLFLGHDSDLPKRLQFGRFRRQRGHRGFAISEYTP